MAPAPTTMTETPILRPDHTCWRKGRAARYATLVDAARYFDLLAETIQRATRSVYVASWDIDSRIALRRGSRRERSATRLRRVLERALNAHPHLRVHVLNWDYAMLYALEREALPTLASGAGSPGGSSTWTSTWTGSAFGC